MNVPELANIGSQQLKTKFKNLTGSFKEIFQILSYIEPFHVLTSFSIDHIPQQGAIFPVFFRKLLCTCFRYKREDTGTTFTFKLKSKLKQPD